MLSELFLPRILYIYSLFRMEKLEAEFEGNGAGFTDVLCARFRTGSWYGVPWEGNKVAQELLLFSRFI